MVERLKVEVGGAGTVAHAGVVLPRHLADRLGLSDILGGLVARAGFVPGRDRGRLLTDLIISLAAGATCLTDVEAMTAQSELFGPRRGRVGLHPAARPGGVRRHDRRGRAARPPLRRDRPGPGPGLARGRGPGPRRRTGRRGCPRSR